MKNRIHFLFIDLFRSYRFAGLFYLFINTTFFSYELQMLLLLLHLFYFRQEEEFILVRDLNLPCVQILFNLSYYRNKYNKFYKNDFSSYLAYINHLKKCMKNTS